MGWKAVIEKANGRLVSTGTVVADTLPAGLEARDLAAAPDFATQMWDPQTLTFKPRPAPVVVDRLTDLDADGELGAVWTRLTAQQRTALRNRLSRLLGPRRWRNPEEPVDLEG